MMKKKQDAQCFIIAVNATKQSQERIFTKCMIELKWKTCKELELTQAKRPPHRSTALSSGSAHGWASHLSLAR